MLQFSGLPRCRKLQHLTTIYSDAPIKKPPPQAWEPVARACIGRCFGLMVRYLTTRVNNMTQHDARQSRAKSEGNPNPMAIDTNALDFAKRYAALGWALVAIPAGKKAPSTFGWQQRAAPARTRPTRAPFPGGPLGRCPRLVLVGVGT